MRLGKKISRLAVILCISFCLVFLFFPEQQIDNEDSRIVIADYSEEVTVSQYVNTGDNRIFEDESQNQLYIKFRNKRNSGRQRFDTTLSPKDFYIINEYTHFFGQPKYCKQRKDEAFLNERVEKHQGRYQLLKKVFGESHTNERFDLLDKCSYKNCFFTCDPHLASQSDALLFHHSDLTGKIASLNLGNDFSRIYSALFPFSRSPKQVWMLWDDEAASVDPILNEFKFNWTITFQSLSEVSYGAYGCLMNRYIKTILVNEIN